MHVFVNFIISYSHSSCHKCTETAVGLYYY